MPWTLLTSGSAIAKAGVNANSTITASGSTLQRWADEAEAAACNIARFDVVTNFTSLTANGRQIFEQYCSAHVGQAIINYDPDVIGRSTAVVRVNILDLQKKEAEKIIKEDKQKTYLNIT